MNKLMIEVQTPIEHAKACANGWIGSSIYLHELIAFKWRLVIRKLWLSA